MLVALRGGWPCVADREHGLGAGTCGVPGLRHLVGQVLARWAQPGGATSVPLCLCLGLGQGWGKPDGEEVGALPDLELFPVLSLQALIPSLYDPCICAWGVICQTWEGTSGVVLLPRVRVGLR